MSVNAYYIDKYEVTNKQYKNCVDDEACPPPNSSQSNTRHEYFGNSEFDNYPVVKVDWYMANAYCKWRNTRLPTDAEWEKAASGTFDILVQWKNKFDCSYANLELSDNLQCLKDTSAIGSYEKDKSDYGVYDMIGNVQEWIFNWYSDIYYLEAPYANPSGPENGGERGVKGGSYNFQVD